MCLKIRGRQRREGRKAYKIVVHNFSCLSSCLSSLYLDCIFKSGNRWQKQVRRKVSLSAVEKGWKEVNNNGYHLFSTLASAKQAFKHLPGCPKGYIENREIWECEVRPKDFIARGIFKLENNKKSLSVVYNTFRFVKYVHKRNN